MADPSGAVEVVGRARSGRRTKDLAQRLEPGEVAVIDHADLDRVAAESLIMARVAAVVNASPSMTGRYPNLGPLLVVAAGIPLIDGAGEGVLDRLDGQVVGVAGDELVVDGQVVARGTRQTMELLEDRIEHARRTVGDTLTRFAENTLSYLQTERHLATDDVEVPDVGIDFKGRHVLVVVRGIDYREDLAALKRAGYLKELRPVLIGVDGGADALRELGFTPDVIIGDFDSVTEETLRCGARLVVHAYRGGRAPGADRLRELGVPFTVFEAPGTSEDIAMLLAYERGAELIVAVGSHSSMEEFLDKGRAGMASTFLVRLKVGGMLVDAKGVSRLYRPVVRTGDVAALLSASVMALVLVALLNPAVRLWFRSLWLLVR